MPRIKDVKPHLRKICEHIKKIDGVKEIYIWGSVARNFNKPNFRARDIDIIAKTVFNSGDLISISDEITNKCCTKKYLEKEGYDPIAIKFSKDFLKFKKYLLENQASRTYCCPHCSQMILAIQTMEGWEAKRHPYFSDKYLLNPAVWKLYEQGKITKEESAQILGVSPDYIDFIQKKRKPTS